MILYSISFTRYFSFSQFLVDFSRGFLLLGVIFCAFVSISKLTRAGFFSQVNNFSNF